MHVNIYALRNYSKSYRYRLLQFKKLRTQLLLKIFLIYKNIFGSVRTRKFNMNLKLCAIRNDFLDIVFFKDKSTTFF